MNDPSKHLSKIKTLQFFQESAHTLCNQCEEINRVSEITAELLQLYGIKINYLRILTSNENRFDLRKPSFN